MGTIDWSDLGFGYYKTNCNVRYTFQDGKWGEMETTDSEYINMHMSSLCLHYGIELFEGLKAYRGIDGKVRLFRIEENAKRMQESAKRLCLPIPTIEQFIEGCIEVVKQNEEFIPPYESGASLYLRPFMIGTTAGLGVKPAQDAMLIIYASPVGPYYKGGIKAIATMMDRNYDRAAPRGTGAVKLGGNYAASIYSMEKSHDCGYSGMLYLDPETHTKIEEFGAANFFGIKDNSYITPKSTSILPSITNKSLRTLAEQLGMKVEERVVMAEELATFEECGACGTAAVISPIGKIFDVNNDKLYTFGDGESAGAKSLELYNRLQDIQYGRIKDTNNWTRIVEL